MHHRKTRNMANNSNQNVNNLNSTLENSSDLLVWIEHALGFFIIPIMSGICVCCFLIYCILVRKQIKKHKHYRLILCKSVNSIFICIICIGYQNRACLCGFNTLLYQIYSLYFILFIGTLLWFIEGILNVYLSFERYSVLNNKTNTLLYKLPIKFIHILSILFSILVFVPDYIAYSINYSAALDNYYLSLTTFGKSTAYNIYRSCLFGLFYLWQITSLVCLNISNIKKYKLFLKSKQKTTANKQSQMMFTKMIIICTISNVIILLFNTASIVIRRLNILNILLNINAINIIQNISLLLISFYFLIQVSICILIDKNVKSELKAYFLPSKNSNQRSSFK